MKHITLLTSLFLFSATSLADVEQSKSSLPSGEVLVEKTKNGGLCLYTEVDPQTGEKIAVRLETHCDGITGEPGSPYTVTNEVLTEAQRQLKR